MKPIINIETLVYKNLKVKINCINTIKSNMVLNNYISKQRKYKIKIQQLIFQN